MKPSPETAIAVRGLRRQFGHTLAVDGLDLDVRRGEMFGLVGPDSAGKTTAIRLLCGLLRPTAGGGRVAGHDLATEVAGIKSKVGYLSQNFTLYGDLTVDENIEFFGDIHGVRDLHGRRDELLQATQLRPFRARLADRLSGGMKKKLALACTLIHAPEVVLLDEPTTGVDPVSRGELWNLLGLMLEQQITILLSTPYLDEAERCDRVGLMHRGRLLACGTPAEIMARHRGQIFRLDCERPDDAYRVLRTAWPATRVVLSGGRVRFCARGGDADLRAAVALLEGRGMRAAAAPEPASLEDAFVGLVTEDGASGAPEGSSSGGPAVAGDA